jgi:hypothetical protein
MGFTAVVSSPHCVGRFGVPAVYGKFSISTSNHEPVYGVTGHDSANFTSEFLFRRHVIVSLWWTVGLCQDNGNTFPAQCDLASLQSQGERIRSKLPARFGYAIPSSATLRGCRAAWDFLHRVVARLLVTVRIPRKTQSIRVLTEAANGGWIGAADLDRKAIETAPAMPVPEPQLLRHQPYQ